MSSSGNNQLNNQENINQDFDKNENIIENKSRNSFSEMNNTFNTLDVTPKVNRDNKHHNIQALKRIENIISSNNNISNNKNSFKTELKPTNVYIKKNINKTYNKPESNNNIFTYSNEEKYSLLKIKKMKSKKFSPYKSTNQLYNKVENFYDEEQNEKNSKNLFFKMNKNKKIYSLRKEYISLISFQDEKGINREFKLFRDDDIGLSNVYKIKNLVNDDDVNSDNETINTGVNRCKQHIKTAIDLMQKNKEDYVSKYMKRMQNDSLK